MYSDLLARFLLDHPSKIGVHRQHVLSASHGHERAAEWMTVHGTAHFDQPTRAENFHRRWPHDVRPTAFAYSFFQDGSEAFIERDHSSFLRLREQDTCLLGSMTSRKAERFLRLVCACVRMKNSNRWRAEVGCSAQLGDATRRCAS
jgi:hypothetical protein